MYHNHSTNFAIGTFACAILSLFLAGMYSSAVMLFIGVGFAVISVWAGVECINQPTTHKHTKDGDEICRP